MAKIKIIKNVAHANKIHPAGAVVDLPVKQADLLVDKGFAVEHDEPKFQQRQQQVPPPPPTPPAAPTGE